ncbi:ketohexokinase-like isoform X2 [Anneissia japonica]|uniref:ketohexokinase-like isoform X2 n=1 Tax=Anneissia japonica TaxID=1529436 RepID=UPI001425A593|nr:ketohexokinase-like isoform X2 [Anneissia japonica]
MRVACSTVWPPHCGTCSIKQLFNRGGNAGNTSVVASQLGGPVEYLGTIASHVFSEIIKKDFQQYNVKFENCRFHENCETPTSCVIINATNGTRTICHGNNSLPELSVDDFSKLNLSKYSWIHFEGRNITSVLEMITIIENFNLNSTDHIRISIELEKPKAKDIDKLLPLGHVVFISKDYAMGRGYTTSESALSGLNGKLRSGALLICAWGDKGAWGRNADGAIFHAPAFSPEKVVDTLGAGDTFNGGVIWALNQGQDLSEALNIGCEIAGRKCGIYGFSGVADKINCLK